MSIFKPSSVLKSDNKPNGYAMVHLIRSCTKLGYFSCGKQIHCYIMQSGFDSNVFVSTALMIFYVKFESVNDAQKVLVEIPDPSVVSWNSLISGYVHAGQFRQALGLFLQFDRSSVGSDSFSFMSALASYGQLNLLQFGRCVHFMIVKFGVECSVFVANCLIDMYGKCESVEAIALFNEMRDKDIISWNSVIGASARNRRFEQAFSFLNQMPNPDTIIYNELISSISQFGNLDDAIVILSNMPSPNSSSWNSIITGYVNRNFAREALEFFRRMHSNDIEMDQFTFSSLLSGIPSLGALTWGVLIHCCSIKCCLEKSIVVGSVLIDMYSKCGQVKKAFQALPDKNLVTWNAMLSGYAHNGNST